MQPAGPPARQVVRSPLSAHRCPLPPLSMHDSPAHDSPVHAPSVSRPGCLQWGPHANVLELDLSSPKLRALTAALGPSFLRIGGSLDKKVVYQMPGTTEPCPAALCTMTSTSFWARFPRNIS